MQKTITAFVLIFFLICASSTIGRTEMRPVPKYRAGIPPFEVLTNILETNRVDSGHTAKKTKNRGPCLTWLADADARLQTQSILQNRINQIFSVRNLGNQLLLSGGAVDYGVRYLHTPVLLITGVSDSKSIEAFVDGYDFLTPDIRHDLDHLHRPLTSKKQQTKTKKKLLLDYVEDNIDFQVTQAVLRYGDRIKSGRLAVIGSVFDSTNSYDKGINKLIIINVNGEKDEKKLKRLKLMSMLDKNLLQYVVRNKKAGGRSQKTEDGTEDFRF